MAQSSILTSTDAAHLLRRAAFGGSAAEVSALVGLTRLQAVDSVTDLTASPAVVQPFTNTEDWWIAHQRAHGWWIDRMATTPTPLEEKLTLFWHSHFATGIYKIEKMQASWDHVQMLREGAMGSFQAMCQQSSVSPAMIVYLDNESNVVGNEQENFARELMELHTVGVGNFTEDDVIAMARAWTGYNTRRRHLPTLDISFHYAPGSHDNGLKTLMGKTRNWSGPEAIDELCYGAGRVATARRVTRKLWRFMVRTDPSSTTINAVADVFAASDLDIRTLVRTILLHEEFWAPSAHHALVKSPAEFVVDLLRRFDLRIDHVGSGDSGTMVGANDIFYLLNLTGQLLFQPPNVNGWGVGSTWISTATMWARARALASVRWRVNELNLFGDPDLPGALRLMSPSAGVQRIFDQMGIDSPSAATRSRLEAWFSALRGGIDSWAIHPNAVMVGGLSPEFQLK